MRSSDTRRLSWLTPREALFLGLAMLGWALFVLALGKDMSWDFRNYHWYAPFAFLNGRAGFDIAVAHQATYYNPLLDVPFYWLATHLPSWAALGILGLVQGANIVPLYLIARALLRIDGSRIAAGALAAFCMTGGLTLGLAGTTYYDNVMSVMVLSGLALVIVNLETLGKGAAGRAATIAGIAGFITGCAVGLKLPEAPYALGFAAALALVPSDGKRRGSNLLAGGLGGVLGVALFAGYWLWRMQQVTGDPLFPYFNDYFHSPLVAVASFRDTRFLPHDWLHTLLDPILFSLDWRVANDLPFTDIRVGLAYVAAIASGAVWLVRLTMRPGDELPLTDRAGSRVLLAFAVVAYVAWVAVFAIYRYILTLEMLAPIVLVATVGSWPLRLPLRLATLAGLAVLIVATTRADFLERAPLGDPYVQVDFPPIAHPDNTMVLMTGEAPMGYLVPELPHQIPVLRIDGWLIQPHDGSRLTAEARKRVDAFKGDLYLIANPYEINRGREALSAYGLKFTLDDCRDFSSNLGGPYLMCPLKRQAGS